MRNLGINGILVGYVSSNESQTLHQPKTMNFLGHFGNSLVDMIPFRVVYHRVHAKNWLDGLAMFGYIDVCCFTQDSRNSRAKRKYPIQSENKKKVGKDFLSLPFSKLIIQQTSQDKWFIIDPQHFFTSRGTTRLSPNHIHRKMGESWIFRGKCCVSHVLGHREDATDACEIPLCLGWAFGGPIGRKEGAPHLGWK